MINYQAIATNVTPDKVRFNKELKYVIIHHNELTTRKPGVTLNKQWINANKFGLPYDLIIDHRGRLDITPTWLFAQTADQYITDASSYKIFNYAAHHISTIGNTRELNIESIHVCVLGDFNKQEPNYMQLNRLQGLLKFIRKEYPDIEIKLHSEVTSTSCPGRNFFSKDIITNGI